jgi:hypothetical protein
MRVSDTGIPAAAALANMLRVPGLSPDVTKIVWSELATYRGRTSVVVRGVQGESGYMHHPAITYFGGRFFASWNDGYKLEGRAGQRVRFATSEDAVKWSEPLDLTGRNPKRTYTACGFWLRDGEMFALAALRDANRDAPKSGEDPLLLAFKWDQQANRFAERQVIARDFFAQNIPQRAPDGDWLILGKSGSESWAAMKSAKGGVKRIDDWTIRDLPGAGKLEEAEWYTLPNGHLVSHFRTRLAPRLMRSYSVDSGVTWTDPIVTNFPEASARHHGLRLSNGLYALLVNPDPSGSRTPFSIALSRDGLIYERIANVRHEPTCAPRNRANPGYQYMRGFEHGGNLYTIYSMNQEAIEVTIIPLAEFETLYR